MSWLMTDRRNHRSDNRTEALHFQLEHTRRSGRFEALVLADEDGLVIASAGELGVCEELGAFAPLFTRSPLGMPMPPMLQGAEVGVRPLKPLGHDLFLACIGGGVARDALLSHSSQGVNRILSSN